MINSKVEIRREIEKVASSYDDTELFSSEYFYEILQGIVSGACAELNRDIYVHAFCNDKKDTTAYTDGDTVVINTLGPLIREIKTTWGKYMQNVGHLIHECGHIFFTDFIAHIERLKAWKSDKTTFAVEIPEVEGIDINEITEYLDTHPNYKKMYLHSMGNLDNVMEDVFIENCLYDKFSGVAALGLQRTRDELYRQSSTNQEIAQKVLDCKVQPIDALISLLLIKRTGYELKSEKSTTDEQQEVLDILFDAMDRVEYEIDALKWEHIGNKRTILLNNLFVKLMYLLPQPKDNEDYDDPEQAIKDFLKQLSEQIKKMLEESNSEEGEGEGTPIPIPFSSSGSSCDYSDEEAESSMGEADKELEKDGSSVAPTGSTAPVKGSKPSKSKSEASRKKASEMSDKTCEDELDKAKKEMAKNEVLEKDEEAHSDELQDEANSIDEKANAENDNAGNTHFNGFQIDRKGTRDVKVNIPGYNMIFKKVEKVSNTLAKKISNILKQHQEEDSPISGYLMGNVFNARDVYRNDGKYFSRINEPDGDLKVVFSVLVDESGSMYGKKTEIARQATILLENTLRKLNVPFMITGHTEYSRECTIKPYCDFDTNDGMDKYRLFDICADSGNIDGAAITYMGEKLVKRPEDIKILIVISDGEPAGTSYYSDYDSNEDTRKAIEHYRKQGIKIFGAVVDEWERVSRIYGDEYSFDARQDSELEKTFCRLIKKYCLVR